jgi:hypothetical protein
MAPASWRRSCEYPVFNLRPLRARRRLEPVGAGAPRPRWPVYGRLRGPFRSNRRMGVGPRCRTLSNPSLGPLEGRAGLSTISIHNLCSAAGAIEKRIDGSNWQRPSESGKPYTAPGILTEDPATPRLTGVWTFAPFGPLPKRPGDASAISERRGPGFRPSAACVYDLR